MRPGFLPGYRVGHATDRPRRTGCTVILPPPGSIAAVDVRGGAPGTRETGVFVPGNLVSQIHAVVFAGGSAFGLAAADGVMGWMRERSEGFGMGSVRVPIVAAAILFDLAVGDSEAYPDAAMGRAACEAASEDTVETGGVGAGTGATIGKILGVPRSSPGGVGLAGATLPGGEKVAALAIVNAFGNVVDPETGAWIAGARADDDRPFDVERALLSDALAQSPLAGTQTTLVCVATTAGFDPASLKRIAMEAHDGVARAVRPAHTLVDGDVVFAIAAAGEPPDILARVRIGAAAAHVTAQAIAAAARAGAGPA